MRIKAMDDYTARTARIVALVAIGLWFVTFPACADQTTFAWDASSGHYNKCDCLPDCDPCEPCPGPEIASYSLWTAPPGTTNFNTEHVIGNVLQATIEVEPNTPVTATATDAAGHVSSYSNTVIYQATSLQPATNLTILENCDDPQPDYFEDFSYSDNTNPAGWMDTDYNNSLQEQDLYHVINNEFATKGNQSNYHSHYDTIFDASSGGFVFTGKMLKGSSTSSNGMGVTFCSQYPDSDTYYRIRSYGGYEFSISSHGYAPGEFLGIPCAANIWYQFKIQVIDTGSATIINIKIWPDGQSEPVDWNAEITDTAAIRGTSGKIGVWAMGTAVHKWDDFKVTKAP